MFSSIRRQLMIGFVGFAIIPLLLAGLVSSSASFRAQEQQALALQREVTRRVSAQITALIGQIENEFRQLTHVGDFSTQTLDVQTQRLHELVADEEGLESLALLDMQGQERARAEWMRFVPPDELADWSQTNEFLLPSTTGETYYGSIDFNDSTGEALMNIAYPLKDVDTNEVEGILLGEIRFKAVWDLIRDSPVEGSQEIFVVDQDHYIVAHGNPSMALRNTQFMLPNDFGMATGLHGDSVVIAWDPITFGEQTLFVVAEQPVSEALALAIHNVTLTGVLLAGALAAAGVAGFLTVRQIVRPIETLAATAQKISAGDLSQQANIDSAAEIVALADSFNTMTTQLRTTLEGLEALNADLERRVDERTADLETANVRLAELDRLKSQFIQDMSHELRTPLSVLGTSVYLLERKPERQAEFVQKLKDQIARLTQLATSALDLSRLDLEKNSVVLAPVSLNEIVTQVASGLMARAESAGLEFVVKKDAQLAHVQGERDQLAQVITNLVTNAINYTPAGSVEVATFADAHCACLQVRDTGRGIAQEDIPHVFERFYRGTGVGSSTISGIGLGLTIVKEIVELHQGRIEVESQVDAGTTFTVWLPLANGNASCI